MVATEDRKISCPVCAVVLSVRGELIGTNVKCPKCETVIKIERPKAEQRSMNRLRDEIKRRTAMRNGFVIFVVVVFCSLTPKLVRSSSDPTAVLVAGAGVLGLVLMIALIQTARLNAFVASKGFTKEDIFELDPDERRLSFVFKGLRVAGAFGLILGIVAFFTLLNPSLGNATTNARVTDGILFVGFVTVVAMGFGMLIGLIRSYISKP